MHGQGSPFSGPLAGQALFFHRCSRILCAALWVGCVLLSSQALAEDEVKLGVRITWGGGQQPKLWGGSIRIDQGTLHRPRRLGYEVDLPGAMQVSPAVIHFHERTASRFDGIDVYVRAAKRATLTIEISPLGQTAPGKTVQIDLDELARHGAASFLEEQLDEGPENWLSVGRIPGDRLRVEFDRSSLIFAPSEQFTFELTPNRLGISPGTALRCVTTLQDANGNELPWRDERELRVDERGGTQVIRPITVELPPVEGVYDVVISLSQKHRFDFIAAKLLMQRRVQLVVISGERPPPDETAWREVGTIEMSNPRWWKQWRRLPELLKGGPWGHPLTERSHQGQLLSQLGGSQYHAAPIPISEIGVPHILEILYPSDLPQTLGVSVLQPNAAGVVEPLQLDSGINVEGSPSRGPFKMNRHRLVFWPRSKTPVLLLTNRRDDAPAAFGKIRVLSGPRRLPRSEIATGQPFGRTLAVYYDKPLFPQNFSAPEVLDPSTSDSLRDWTTFLEGGRRLVDYLNYVGYNAAVVSVAREGSSLYPSQLLEPTPRYDNGAFFSTGQDPLPKDVLEALFRLFDREGLVLIPALHFSTPLPELEQLLARGGPEAVGLEPLNRLAQPWHASTVGTRQGQGPHYNPLDQRVQQVIGRVVQELIARYAHHPSFGGLALQVAPDTFVQLLDEGWSLDDRTVTRFESETKLQIPLADRERHEARAHFLLGPAREKWLQWRADQIRTLQQNLGREIGKSSPNARLFLITNDMVNSWSLREGMQPRLNTQSRFTEGMLAHGLDRWQGGSRSPVTALRPQRWAPLTSLRSQGVNIQLNRSLQVDRYHDQQASGVLAFHEPSPLRLPAFDADSPFPRGKITTWITAHIPPAGASNRARFVHSLATLDAKTIVDGGWMLPLGQEEALAEIFAVFRALPSRPFETAEPKSARALGSGIVVRTLAESNHTYIYLVNDSPWAGRVHVDLAAPANCRVQPLGPRGLSPLVRSGPHTTWRVDLEPYDVVGAVLSAPHVQATDWRVDYAQDVAAELGAAVQRIQSRVHYLKKPVPLDLLRNPDFEEPPTAEEPVPGWKFDTQPGVLVEIDKSSAAQGKQSLHFRNDNPTQSAWIRSNRLPLPKTGRIAVFVSIRTADADNQPPFRVAFDIEGPQNQNLYIISPLGRDPGGRPAHPLAQDWPSQPLRILNNELPAIDAGSVYIGFDLIGKGEVWIDDVQVFDLHFADDEHGELLRKSSAASYNLVEGHLAECYRSLDGYWPRYLLEFVPEPQVPRVSRLPAGRRVPAATAVPDKKPSWINRIFEKIKDPF